MCRQTSTHRISMKSKCIVSPPAGQSYSLHKSITFLKTFLQKYSKNIFSNQWLTEQKTLNRKWDKGSVTTNLCGGISLTASTQPVVKLCFIPRNTIAAWAGETDRSSSWSSQTKRALIPAHPCGFDMTEFSVLFPRRPRLFLKGWSWNGKKKQKTPIHF